MSKLGSAATMAEMGAAPRADADVGKLAEEMVGVAAEDGSGPTGSGHGRLRASATTFDVPERCFTEVVNSAMYDK